jgi:hypothetical protein
MAKSKDPVEIAHSIFDDFLSKADSDSVTPKEPEAKDPKRQAAGRKGGSKGGEARAAKQSPRKRKAIAKKAAETRWKNS